MRNSAIFIPEYARATLGLHNNTELHLLPSRHPRQGVIEVLISTIPKDSWSDIWRIESTLRDRPGLIAELTSILKHRSIDILISRCTAFDQGRYLHVDLHVDATQYMTSIDGTTVTREENPLKPLFELRAWIVDHFIDDLEFLRHNKPMLSIRHNLVLYRASKEPDPTTVSLITKGWIELPSHLTAPSGTRDFSGARNGMIAFAVADEDHLVLRLFLMHPSSAFVHITIYAPNQIGQVSTITDSLRANAYNIYQMYARNVRRADMCAVDLLVELPNVPGQLAKDVGLTGARELVGDT